MFFWVLLVGLVLAYWSLLDWRDHEIEDTQTIGFLLAGALVSLSLSLLAGDIRQAIQSCGFAVAFGLFGLVLYRFDLWGGADVKILAGLGFLSNTLVFEHVPSAVWPLEVSFFLNVCLASIAYFIPAEIYYWKTTGRFEKEVPYVPAFFLAWILTFLVGDGLWALLSALKIAL